MYSPTSYLLTPCLPNKSSIPTKDSLQFHYFQGLNMSFNCNETPMKFENVGQVASTEPPVEQAMTRKVKKEPKRPSSGGKKSKIENRIHLSLI